MHVVHSDGFNVRGGLERNLKGGCGEAFCGGCFAVFLGGCFAAFVKWGTVLSFFVGGYLDITWHLLESCFTAFLRRAAFTAYFEAVFFAAFFRVSCFVAFFGGGCFAAFFRGSCFATFLEEGLERPLRSLHIKTITGSALLKQIFHVMSQIVFMLSDSSAILHSFLVYRA